MREAGFRGVVICLVEGANRIRLTDEGGVAQAGASLQVFSRRCQRAGRTGMEFACGIPGTVGGAIRGNAGAWGGETMARLIWLKGVDLASGAEMQGTVRSERLVVPRVPMDGVVRVLLEVGARFFA